MEHRHLFNPAWPPHAHFHDALFLLFLDGMSLVVLWLLWRPSKEPEVAIKVAALFSVTVWTPFFISGADCRNQPVGQRRCTGSESGGHEFAAKLIVAAVLLLLTAAAYGLARDGRSDA